MAPSPDRIECVKHQTEKYLEATAKGLRKHQHKVRK